MAAHVAHEAARWGVVLRLAIRPAAPTGHTWANAGAHGVVVASPRCRLLPGRFLAGRKKESERVYIHLLTHVYTRLYTVQAGKTEGEKSTRNKVFPAF